MRLKKYQIRALEAFESFWGVVCEIDRTKKARARKIAAALDEPMEKTNMGDVLRETWEKLGVKSPVFRVDARGDSIPHVCMKIPTGGGKTLLGAKVLETVKMQTGLVLWITPSRAIFRQTWNALARRTHFYRHILERASGGRVKLFRKDESISRMDLENYLCVMPLMLQAAARKNQTNKDFLKIFRDTGKYPGFFPEADDPAGNKALLDEQPDLDINDLGDGRAGTVKHSLLNVLKLARPFVVLDEAHNAYTEQRREQLGKFNPRFVLELSATPDRAVSNIITSVPGADLQKEEMIKLPLNIVNYGADAVSDAVHWQFTLSKAKEKLDSLAAEAEAARRQNNRYIRPIMLVRVQRVDREKRGEGYIHAEDVRDYLMRELNVPEAHIRRKTAKDDEIADEDLLSEYSEVRYILTKNALQEGWDCPFAYVLTLLDTTRSARALTQMTGRVLRQPGAKRIGRPAPALDESYVFCMNRDVGETMDAVKRGLEAEGMGDLAEFVKTQDAAGRNPKTENVRRRKQFRGMQIFLPVVMHRDGKKYRPLHYERDVLGAMNWQKIADADVGGYLGSPAQIREIIAQVDLLHGGSSKSVRGNIETDKTVAVEFFVRRLADVIPNPWLAAKIVGRALSALRKKNTEETIFGARYNFSESMKLRLAAKVEEESERVFCQKLANHDIVFELHNGDGFELAETIQKILAPEDVELGHYGQGMEKALYETVLAREFNGLEKDFAVHLDGHDAITWWHRLVSRQSYFLQGWKRGRVYPDFVVCVGKGRGKNRRVAVLETKGMHLSGNPDTKYKESLFKKLEEVRPNAVECGSLSLGKTVKIPLLMRIIPESGWRETLDGVIG